MLTPSQAGFRRLLPLLRPHLRELLWGGCCMVIYVGSFPLLVQLAGDLFPALGSGDLVRVLQLIGLALLIFAVQFRKSPSSVRTLSLPGLHCW